MMNPNTNKQITYALHITPQQGANTTFKDQLRSWLNDRNIFEFVEGCIDNLHIDHCYNEEFESQCYEVFNGHKTPVIIYRFNEASLKALAQEIERDFKGQCTTHITASPTQEWQDGWKQSFKSFTTQRFMIYPPWEKHLFKNQKERTGICIDPGMAFGTGQHATTQLCLRWLEKQKFNPQISVIDIGTGSGILAIAAKKLNAGQVFASDISEDAIRATQHNLSLNHVELDQIYCGSIPQSWYGQGHIVIANILPVVLQEIFDDLVKLLKANPSPLPTQLVLSGLLVEHQADFCRRAAKYNLKLLDSAQQDDWQLLVFGKKASTHET